MLTSLFLRQSTSEEGPIVYAEGENCDQIHHFLTCVVIPRPLSTIVNQFTFVLRRKVDYEQMDNYSKNSNGKHNKLLIFRYCECFNALTQVVVWAQSTN